MIRVKANTGVMRAQREEQKLIPDGKKGKNLSLVVKDEHSAEGPAHVKIRKRTNGRTVLQPRWIFFFIKANLKRLHAIRIHSQNILE